MSLLPSPPLHGENCTVRMTFDLHEDLHLVTYVRKKARSMLETLDVSRQDADDLEMILGELATNVVLHAGGGHFRVSIELSSNEAVILVTDNGVGFSPDAVPPAGTARPDTRMASYCERIGGFGLPLVRCIADAVDITANPLNGMTVRAAKSLQPKH